MVVVCAGRWWWYTIPTSYHHPKHYRPTTQIVKHPHFPAPPPPSRLRYHPKLITYTSISHLNPSTLPHKIDTSPYCTSKQIRVRTHFVRPHQTTKTPFEIYLFLNFIRRYIILLFFLKNDPLWTHKSDYQPGEILKIANILTFF